MLASSELAPNMFGASSKLASVMEFGFKHTIGHIRDGFDPTNSVEALKEAVDIRIRLQSHQVHLTHMCYNNTT